MDTNKRQQGQGASQRPVLLDQKPYQSYNNATTQKRIKVRQMTVDNLAPKIARRDKQAFSDLYEAMRKLVFSVCLGIVKNSDYAEDLTQDTFVTVWEKTYMFKGGSYKAWILSIAKNKSLNFLKRQQRQVFTEYEDNPAFVTNSFEDDMALGEVLKAALACLDVTDREIVLLKNSGVKTKEIATLFDLPRGTVSWRYSEALKKLRKYLEEKA